MNLLNTYNYINGLDETQRPQLLESLKESLNQTESYLISITKWIVILVFVFFLFKSGQMQEFEVSGLKLNLVTYFDRFYPPALAGLILAYSIISIHKAQVGVAFSLVFNSIYGVAEDSSNEQIYKLLTPVGLLNKMVTISDGKKVSGCFLNIIASLPLTLIQLIPIIIVCFGLNKIWVNHFGDLIGKTVFFLTSYFLLFGIGLFCWFFYEKGQQLFIIKKNEESN